MHHLSLRGRVLALFSLIMLAAIVGAVLLLISNAREAVRAEIQALIDGGVTALDAAKTYLFEMFAKALSTRGTT